MTAVFADSSALVKLYADEAGADVMQGAYIFLISQLARVEVPAALWRKHRLGELSAADTRVLVSAFEADYFGSEGEAPRFLVILTSEDILDSAARLTGIHRLRAYDAVQLASARSTASEASQKVLFAAFDNTLRSAAATEGLELLPA